jgi:hypothetical protein
VDLIAVIGTASETGILMVEFLASRAACRLHGLAKKTDSSPGASMDRPRWKESRRHE